MSAYTISYDDTSLTVRVTGLTVGNDIRFYLRLTSQTVGVLDETYEATSTTMTKTFSILIANTSYTVNVHDGNDWIGATTFTSEASSSGGGDWELVYDSFGTISDTTSLTAYLTSTYTLYRFAVSFASSGTATFYTTGSVDVIGWVGTTRTDDGEGNPSSYLKYDDDSGSQSNCSIEIDVTAGTTYYFWIRSYDGTETGTVKVYIDPPAAWTYTNVSFSTISAATTKLYSFATYTTYRCNVTFTVSGTARFYTTGSSDTYGYLGTTATGFDKSTGAPTSYTLDDDDSGDDCNCSIEAEVVAGTTYYFWVRLYDGSNTGTVTICIDPPAQVRGNGQWYVYSGGWKKVTPYIYNGGWKQADPYIY